MAVNYQLVGTEQIDVRALDANSHISAYRPTVLLSDVAAFIANTAAPADTWTTISGSSVGAVTANSIISTAGAQGMWVIYAATAAASQYLPSASLLWATNPNAVVGDQTYFHISNVGTSVGNGTLTLASSSDATTTLSGNGIVLVQTEQDFLITYTSSAAATVKNVSIPPLVGAKFTNYLTSVASTTFNAGDVTGAGVVYLQSTGSSNMNVQFRTAAQLFADIPLCTAGYTWELIINNTASSTTSCVFTIANSTDGSVTVTKPGTTAQSARSYICYFTGASAVTIQHTGVGPLASS